MIFKKTFLFLGFLVGFLAGPVHATCNEYLADGPNQTYEFSYICNSSSKSLDYQIIRRITEKIDFEFFQFDKRGWNILCTKAVYEDREAFNDCKSFGFKNKTDYKSKVDSAHLLLAIEFDKIDDFYKKRTQYDFVFPNHIEEFSSYGCAVFFSGNNLELLTSASTAYKLGECLLQFELYQTTLLKR